MRGPLGLKALLGIFSDITGIEMQKRIDEIELKVSQGEMNAHQVFTQMRQLIGRDRHGDMGELTRSGQIKKGDTLEVFNVGMKELHEVDQVIDSGTSGEEIILDSKLNLYFITSMYLNASSWAKQVRVVFTA